jgi:CubicO group peptidase (beta-lactamase class C family)
VAWDEARSRLHCLATTNRRAAHQIHGASQGVVLISAIQDRIQNLLDELVNNGQELGVQVAVYRNGEPVVDAWSGMMASGGAAVDGDTLFPVFSTTKGIAATIIHLLVERGQIDYDTPVAEVWPEFATGGKEHVTLRHCLTHTSGLPYLPMGIDWETLHDWDAMCAAFAVMKPAWPPGTRMEYHAMTYGWLLGEIARRVDGRAFAQIVQEEICRPLNINTLFCGLPDGMDARVATLEMPDFAMPEMDDTQPQSVPRFVWPLHEMMNRPEARRGCQPASNGIMNARAIARHYAALLPGGVDGVELLPPARVNVVATPHRIGNDDPLQMALGYGLVGGQPGDTYVSAFGHGGYGGSIGLADRDTGLAFGFTKNLFSSADTTGQVMMVLRDAMGA